MDGMKKFVEDVILEVMRSIERENMPQVRGKDISEILAIFDENKIKYNKERVECRKLQPTQKDYNSEKLERIKDSMKKGTWNDLPIFISEEELILDGHHRWLAYKEVYGDDFKIPVIRVKMPQEEALYVFSIGSEMVNKKINEVSSHQRKIIVIYPGRFQPFHKNHYEAYQHLVKKFGKNNVYISTSNKVNFEMSPFNFNEKKKIITTMFGIPAKSILEVSNPYNNLSYKNLGDMNNDILVVAVGEKDRGRLLGGKYYKEWTEGDKKPFGEHGYVYTIPLKKFKINGNIVSGTSIRKIFRIGDDKVKKQLFKKLYDKFDQTIYDLIVKKLNEMIILSSEVIEEFIVQNDIKKIISEITISTNAKVDDGPATFYQNPEAYKKGRLIVKQKSVEELIKQLGWQVIDWLIGKKHEYTDYNYRTNIVGDVSFGDVGVRNSNYTDPLDKYQKYINKIANTIGYALINWLSGDVRKNNIINDPKKTMALYEPLIQNTDNSSKPLGENTLSKEWWKRKFLYEQNLLLEGGAYGHLIHPFEDWNLTFGDIRKMIEIGLEGKLEMVEEKVDGQNLMVSWRNNKLVAARNKSHLKNFGAEALNKEQMSVMFAGRGDIHDAFVFAMEDLENAISKLSDKDRDDIFGNGRKFMNLEVVYPATENIIPYGLSTLLFHGLIEYNEDGKAIGEDKSSAIKLSKLIKDVNANIQKNFTISNSPILKLPKVADYSNQKKKFISELDRLRREFKLKDTDNVTEYHKRWWERFIFEQANKLNYGIPNHILVKLVNRWALGNKSEFKVSQIKKEIDNDEFRKWVLDFDKKDHSKQVEKNIQPFERLFLKLGVQIMKNVSNLLVANPNEVTQKIIANIEKVAKEMENSKDVTKIEKFKKQMENLAAIGGYDAIVPSEGLVFTFKGKTYKLTGTFFPIHKIISLLKYA